jgi:hypothetical protein
MVAVLVASILLWLWPSFVFEANVLRSATLLIPLGI